MAFSLSACSTEEQVVSQNHFFSNVPGVQSQLPGRNTASILPPPEDVPEDKLIQKNVDGSVTLRSPQIRYLFEHLRRELTQDPIDQRRIYDQLVSEATKRYLRSQDKEPTTAVQFLIENRTALLQLMANMPAAERTPGVFLERGDSRTTYRLRLTGPMTRVSTYTELWMSLENGEWKFYWLS